MAFKTGQAANPTDLYNKLTAFLTTDPDLTAAGQNWTQVWTGPAAAPTDRVLRGPGLSGQDQVYVGMRLTQRPASDAYFIEFTGMTGIIDNSATYRDHVNEMPNYLRLFTDAGAVTYWFIANGRRFIVVLKISTVFESVYCGLFLPYADPSSYPYPMYMGASSGPADQPGSALNWRTVSDRHRSYPWGYYDLDGNGMCDSTGWVMSPAGVWQRNANNGNTTPVITGPENTQGTYFEGQNSDHSLGSYQLMNRLIEGYGGDRLLIPLTLIQTDPTDETYGILDGVYRVQGVANATENIITADGIDHMVVQDVFRTDFSNFYAVALA